MKQPPEPKAPVADQASEQTDAKAYRVTLPMFEGPLDLLLHLIQKHELDILEIPIGFVAQKYLEYIRLMEDLSIDIASEYLVMAATLAYIKSRSLLPPDPTQASEEDHSEEEEEDPRAELIRKLLEYQKYKHAADNLGQRELLGRDVFGRGFAPEHNEDEAPLAPMSLFKLMDAFEGVLKRAKQVQEHQIDFEKVSISDRIGQIVDRLRISGTLTFVQLFDGDFTRVEMVVTFLALLEMTKLRITRLFQDGPLAPISVELALGPGELHEFEIQRKLGETPSVFQKIDSWDESRVEIPNEAIAEAGLSEEVALDEQSLADFELTPEELGEDNEWAQDLVWVEGESEAPTSDTMDDLDVSGDDASGELSREDDVPVDVTSGSAEGEVGTRNEGSDEAAFSKPGVEPTADPESEETQTLDAAADARPPVPSRDVEPVVLEATTQADPFVNPVQSEVAHAVVGEVNNDAQDEVAPEPDETSTSEDDSNLAFDHEPSAAGADETPVASDEEPSTADGQATRDVVDHEASSAVDDEATRAVVDDEERSGARADETFVASDEEPSAVDEGQTTGAVDGLQLESSTGMTGEPAAEGAGEPPDDVEVVAGETGDEPLRPDDEQSNDANPAIAQPSYEAEEQEPGENVEPQTPTERGDKTAAVHNPSLQRPASPDSDERDAET